MDTLTMMLALHARREGAVRDAFEALGATSPAAARPLAELPDLDPDHLAALVDRGIVREGPPGHFYYYRRVGRRLRRTIVKMLLFWLVVVLVPLLLIKLREPR